LGDEGWARVAAQLSFEVRLETNQQTTMKNTILTRLQEIESEHQVKILYACESGSRAWGFPSSDSDYDVRFLYLRPTEWYLSLRNRRDVIELPIQDALDIHGWDLQKALLLLRKSNPPLMEWLGSPIVYCEPYSLAAQMRELAKTYYSPKSSSYHYLHMASGNYKDYMKGEEVWVKKYFYILRPILAVKWIEAGLGLVPTQFEVLVDELVTDPELKSAIHSLLADKRAGQELDRGPRIDPISDFIDQEMGRLEQRSFDFDRPADPIEQLDALFLNALAEVWGP
jgi:predicted nucleotidyltransferase